MAAGALLHVSGLASTSVAELMEAKIAGDLEWRGPYTLGALCKHAQLAKSDQYSLLPLFKA